MSEPKDATQATPLLGDLSLDYAQVITHQLNGGFTGTLVAGLEGEVQQRLARPSHIILIQGLMMGENAADHLKSLQEKTAAGEELSFAADITTALDLKKVVITHFEAREVAGQPGRYSYALTLVESPPLPPPAQLGGGFGFGLDDLGFDTDLLGDLSDLAGDIAGAIDDALDVLDQLSALTELGDFGLGNFLKPMDNVFGGMSDLGGKLNSNTKKLTDGLS